MQADVQALMQGELGDWLRDQSAMREQARKEAFSRWMWGGAALIPVLAFLWIGGGALGGWKFIISAIGVIGVFAWGYMPIAEALREIKVGINSAIARSLGISYEHDVDPGAEFEACKRYGLLPSFDRSSFEDRWYGHLEGHGFDLYECHLEERRGSGKNRRWVTVFRGAIIMMEFGRPFHSTTLLQRAGKHKKWLGLGGRKDNVSFSGHRLDYVDQVHPDFEDVFEVWSDDQVEARTLVHPSYVEHLLSVENAFKGDAVRALFARGSVIAAVESGDLFESGSLSSHGDEQRVATTARQIGSLAKLALAINQNERGRVKTTIPTDPANAPSRRRRSVRP